MGAFGSAAAAVFGVIWTIFALSMGAPLFFALFGVIFVIVGIVQAAYNFKNATSKDRFSAFDITDSEEEQDPLNRYFSGQSQAEATDSGNDAGTEARQSGEAAYCPYCGTAAEEDFSYCAKCGKKLPE